jgi:hypothetical protein
LLHDPLDLDIASIDVFGFFVPKHAFFLWIQIQYSPRILANTMCPVKEPISPHMNIGTGVQVFNSPELLKKLPRATPPF